MTTQTVIEAVASAIANARGARRGAPAVSNILEVLQKIAGGKLYDEVMEDAKAALEAAGRAREPHQEREEIARWMMERSYATGHGDTITDLLNELEGQIKERAGRR